MIIKIVPIQKINTINIRNVPQCFKCNGKKLYRTMNDYLYMKIITHRDYERFDYKIQ
jgi:hypothetical protein